jgi:membrane-bound serine protease (ClpP class)
MIASIILALHLLGFIALENAAYFLFVVGVLLIVSEIAFPSGIVAFNGLLALYIGYALKYGEANIFGFQLGWDVFFGVAFIEFVLLATVVYLFLRLRRKKVTTGTESLIGHSATVIEWSGKSGRVRVQGEEWDAASAQMLELKKNEKVTIEAVDNLTLKIKP